uniref:Uncharacterized protein n=1 Tax=Cucumis melo TaxID=3656 RepID=A0A9I9ECS3_CUCME
MNTLMTTVANSELLQKRTLQSPCVLTILEKVIKVFLCLPTKQTTKRPNKRCPFSKKPINRVNPTKKDLSDKEPGFLEDLNPPNYVKK